VGFTDTHVIKGIGAFTVGPHADAGDTTQDVGDPNSPYTGFMSFARMNNPQYLLAAGRPDSSQAAATLGTEMGIFDITADKFLPVLTNVTAGLKQFDDGSGTLVDGIMHDLIAEVPDPAKNMAPTSNAYLALYSSAEPGGASAPVVWNQLIRVQIDLPADPTKGKAGDIKVTTLASEDLMKAALADTSENDTNYIYGLSVGREISPGKRVIYLSDWNGNLFTLTPQ